MAKTGEYTRQEKPEVSTPKADDVAEQMRRLGAELAAAADDVGARDAKLREVEEFLGSLRVKDFPELAESPVVQQFVSLFTIPGAPGQVRRPGTLAQVEREWTWRDVGQFETMEVIPFENIPIIWNGLRLDLRARQRRRIPRPFYDIYMEHLKAVDQAAIHEAYLLGQSDAPPDPNWQTDATALARAYSTLGLAFGVRGGTLASGPIRMEPEEASGAQSQ